MTVMTVALGVVAALAVPALAKGPGGGGGGGNPGSQPYIQFKSGGYSVTEGTTNAVIQLQRVPKGVDQVYFSTNGSPNGAVGAADCSDPATDYIIQTNHLYGIGSNGVGTAFVPICNNSFYEHSETVNMVLSAAGTTPVGQHITAQLTISDNDKAPVLSVNNRTGAEGTTQTFTVTASSADPLLPMSFHWATSDGTATVANGDYASQSGNKSIAPGDTSVTFDVTSLNDNVFEPGTDEYFWVNLSAPVNASISSTAGKGKDNLQDINSPPTLTVDDVSNSEGNVIGFTVTRHGMTTGAATFDWTTVADGTASASGFGPNNVCGAAVIPTNDYLSNSGNDVSIAPGGATGTATLNVTTCQDPDPEANENFHVTLSDANFASISDGSGVGTINDDENGDFEIGDLSGWSTEQTGAGPLPTNSTAQANTGTHSALLGTDGIPGDEPGDGFSYLYRQIVVPATGSTNLSVWVLEHGDNNFIDDQQFGQIKDSTGTTVLGTIFDDGATFNAAWQHKTLDLTPFAGQTVYILFGVHQDIAGGDPTAMWVDDLTISHTP